MELVIRQPGKDLIRFLLDKAVEDGFDISVVRLLPDGLYIPIELADKAGMLDEFKTVPEVKDDKPKRASSTGRKSKRGAAEAPTEDPEEDPWS